MKQQWPRRAFGLGILGMAFGLGSTVASTASAASDPKAWPDQMIRLVVPFTAGGSSDVQARMLADRLGKLYKQPVVVENRPGAGGHIGGKFVADAPADGYTLLLGSIGLHATYGVFKKLNYDPSKDLKVVTVLAEMPHVVVANPSLPANDLKQLVATGSPFTPVTVKGKQYAIAQCNNSYIFPGIGLGVIAAGASRVTDEMLMAASETLANHSPLVNNGEGPVLPELKDIQAVSRAIAFAVGKVAQEQGVAVKTSAEALLQAISDNFWQPEYRNYRRTSI